MDLVGLLRHNSLIIRSHFDWKIYLLREENIKTNDKLKKGW